MIKGFIFDLDGVIVDTAKYHYLCWKNIAKQVGYDFTHKDNEQLKGVSRVASLDLILELANFSATPEQKENWLISKNEEYLGFVRKMNTSEILPGVEELVRKIRAKGHKISLGSASKNAKLILETLGILDWFDTMVDGTVVTTAKPDPEVFTTAANMLGVPYKHCVVFEDAIAGVQAANRADMTSIGIGDPKVLQEADFCFSGFDQMKEDFIQNLLS